MHERNPETTPDTRTESEAELRRAAGVWLRAEAAEEPGAAEESGAELALAALLAALPAPFEPSADFAEVVLRRAGVVAADLPRRARWLTAASLALVAVGAFWLLPLGVQLVLSLEPAALLAAWVDLTQLLAGCLGEMAQWGGRLLGFGRAVWLVAASPPVLVTAVTSAALTLLMVRWLSALLTSDMTSERSAFHVTAR